jgi:RNA-directed DNA polymerase
MDRPDRHPFGPVLAAAFLAGDWSQEGLVRRGAEALQPAPPWLPRIAASVLAAYREPPADRRRELASVIAVHLAELPWSPAAPPSVVRRFTRPPRAVRWRWPVPRLETAGDLAAWLGIEPPRLDWLADVRGWERDAPDRRLRHYRCAWTSRPDAPVRLLEQQPKPMLKAVQRRILHELLDRIPAHPAAHGFVAGRSVRSHAEAHVGAPTVLRFDLTDFFATVPAARIFGVLRSAGYPEGIAHLLCGLMTTALHRGSWAQVPVPGDPQLLAAHRLLGRRLAAPHLPQGAPTSPMLANLVAFSLDRRMTALARSLRGRYTRYADDLVLSGGPWMARRPQVAFEAVSEIVAAEGFVLHARKTRVLPAGQRQLLCGVVINRRLNAPRDDYDRLRATLHNAARDGPDSQNLDGVADFRAHLLGRIAWVSSLNPQRGARLRTMLDAIAWPPTAIS